jgi:3-oxoacyl-[acyl-carrier-protein] synthase-3
MEDPKDAFFRMDGKKVFSFAVEKGSEIINEAVSMAGIGKEEIKAVIPHQANIIIIREIACRTDIGFDRFFITLDRYGNTAAASVLISLDEALRSSFVSEGDIVILAAFGGGLSWGANIIRV